jgi:hypothetical protein
MSARSAKCNIVAAVSLLAAVVLVASAPIEKAWVATNLKGACGEMCTNPYGSGCILHGESGCSGPCSFYLWCPDTWESATTGTIYLECDPQNGSKICSFHLQVTCRERDCECLQLSQVCRPQGFTGTTESHQICTEI